MRELLGVALALGFDASRDEAELKQIDQLRTELAANDPPAGARAGHELSPQWQSSVQHSSALTGWLPLWVSSLVVAALLAVLFFGLELSLGAKSDRLYARIAALNAPAVAAPRALPAPQPRLAGLLAEQVAAQSVSVRDEVDRSVVVVPGAQLFAPGDATLLPAGHELLRPIASALEHTPGRIEVIGHTDASFAHSARYPSDWDLSVDRARTVEEALRGLGLEPSRLTYDGRAGIEPLRADGQSRVPGGDGRVEIVLLAGR
jgi:type VI secretion system protein ImpK